MAMYSLAEGRERFKAGKIINKMRPVGSYTPSFKLMSVKHLEILHENEEVGSYGQTGWCITILYSAGKMHP